MMKDLRVGIQPTLKKRGREKGRKGIQRRRRGMREGEGGELVELRLGSSTFLREARKVGE